MKDIMTREGVGAPQGAPSGRGRVVIDPHPRKEKEMLDKDGNVIDPRTKQIIRKADNS